LHLDLDIRKSLLDLARGAIRESLGGCAAAEATAEDSSLQQPAGCFVSLHNLQTHVLRGCVGRLDAQQALWLAVRDSARSVLTDPRFREHPVTLAELPRLEIEISVLSPLRAAGHPLDFDLVEHGIYLMMGGRTGCFLPQVARETGWSKEQLLTRLCTEKLDMPAMTWKHPEARLFTFTAVIIGPEAFEPQGT
jgi:AmmeMemoRadiSam system protein A